MSTNDIKHFQEDGHGFKEADAERLQGDIRARLGTYLSEHAMADLAVSVLDFAVELIYKVGREDERAETAIKTALRREDGSPR